MATHFSLDTFAVCAKCLWSAWALTLFWKEDIHVPRQETKQKVNRAGPIQQTEAGRRWLPNFEKSCSCCTFLQFASPAHNNLLTKERRKKRGGQWQVTHPLVVKQKVHSTPNPGFCSGEGRGIIFAFVQIFSPVSDIPSGTFQVGAGDDPSGTELSTRSG